MKDALGRRLATARNFIVSKYTTEVLIFYRGFIIPEASRNYWCDRTRNRSRNGRHRKNRPDLYDVYISMPQVGIHLKWHKNGFKTSNDSNREPRAYPVPQGFDRTQVTRYRSIGLDRRAFQRRRKRGGRQFSHGVVFIPFQARQRGYDEVGGIRLHEDRNPNGDLFISLLSSVHR